MNKKTLYFEGAGSETPESIASGVGNCRICTAFRTTSGLPVYLELFDCPCTDRKSNNYGKNLGIIDAAHYITTRGDAANRSHITQFTRSQYFDYTPQGILDIVRRIGGEFDEIKVRRLLHPLCRHQNAQ